VSDESTVTAAEAEACATRPLATELAVSVAHHPDRDCLGQRLLLADGEGTVLGRKSRAFEAGTFEDARVSREHARLVRRGACLELTDLESRNGCYHNGLRAARAELVPGDVLAVGPVLLLVHWAARLPPRVGDGPVAVSPAMLRVLAEVETVARSSTTVLIQGPTGVGKEIVARQIHGRSERPGAFVAVNCAAVADGVMQSELFGHARGAFSGADRERPGLIESARGGTLLFDEIGDASPALQASLLRLLEQREYRRVGDDRSITTDARFLAATHVPLEAAARTGGFRQDLLGRLRRYCIEVPALAGRPDDIVPLARRFAADALGREVDLSAELTLALLRHAWPENVRELAAVVEQTLLEAGGIEPLPLSDGVRRRLGAPAEPARAPASSPAEPAGPPAPTPPRGEPVERPSAEGLRLAFDQAGGNMRALAVRLGVSRATIYRWVRELGLEVAGLRRRG
jgi:DNA-binding NtrC family response regulator